MTNIETPTETFRRALDRLARVNEVLTALRVQSHSWSWPPGHSEAPTRPSFVAEFEQRHGPAPQSAERLVAEFQPTP